VQPPAAADDPDGVFVKFQLTISAVLLLGALAGCAGVTADVDVRGNLSEPAQGGVKYRFAPAPVQIEAGATAPYEAMLRDGLARHGFAETQGEHDAARYLVSVAWATRSADVTVTTKDDCPDGQDNCRPAQQQGAAFPWFGKAYVHTLTLRFFALPDGTEAYRVIVVKRDRDADAGVALPYLVTGALARLPYAGASQWRVKLREAGEPGSAGAGAARAMPEVVSVKPVQPPQ
jgi:hypothetical protein